MTEEERKTIEDFKKVIANYFSYSSYDLFYSNLVNTGIKGTIQNTFADMVSILEKLQKENKELKEKNDNNNVYKDLQEDLTSLLKREFIPKDKIREKIKELEEYIVKIEEETCGRCITIGEDMCIRYLKELLEEE